MTKGPPTRPQGPKTGGPIGVMESIMSLRRAFWRPKGSFGCSSALFLSLRCFFCARLSLRGRFWVPKSVSGAFCRPCASSKYRFLHVKTHMIHFRVFSCLCLCWGPSVSFWLLQKPSWAPMEPPLGSWGGPWGSSGLPFGATFFGQMRFGGSFFASCDFVKYSTAPKRECTC